MLDFPLIDSDPSLLAGLVNKSCKRIERTPPPTAPRSLGPVPRSLRPVTLAATPASAAES